MSQLMPLWQRDGTVSSTQAKGGRKGCDTHTIADGVVSKQSYIQTAQQAQQHTDFQAQKLPTQPRAPLPALRSSSDAGSSQGNPHRVSSVLCIVARATSTCHSSGHLAYVATAASSQNPAASSRSMGLSDKTPTVLAQAETTPVSSEPQAKEHSLAAFDKRTCQNSV